MSRQYNWVKTARNTLPHLFVLRVKRLSSTWRGTMIPSSLSLLQILLWASFQGKHRNNSHSFQSIRFKIWIFPFFVPFLSVASLCIITHALGKLSHLLSLVLFKRIIRVPLGAQPMNNNINNNGQTTQIKSALKSTSRSLVYRQNQHQHQQMENMNEQQRRVSFQSGRPPVVEGGARLAQLRAARKRAAQQKAQETSSNTNGQGISYPLGPLGGSNGPSGSAKGDIKI